MRYRNIYPHSQTRYSYLLLPPPLPPRCRVSSSDALIRPSFRRSGYTAVVLFGVGIRCCCRALDTKLFPWSPADAYLSPWFCLRAACPSPAFSIPPVLLLSALRSTHVLIQQEEFIDRNSARLDDSSRAFYHMHVSNRCVGPLSCVSLCFCFCFIPSITPSLLPAFLCSLLLLFAVVYVPIHITCM